VPSLAERTSLDVAATAADPASLIRASIAGASAFSLSPSIRFHMYGDSAAIGVAPFRSRPPFEPASAFPARASLLRSSTVGTGSGP